MPGALSEKLYSYKRFVSGKYYLSLTFSESIDLIDFQEYIQEVQQHEFVFAIYTEQNARISVISYKI